MYELIDVSKEYLNGSNKLVALNHVTLRLPEKGLFFIVGKSGSGKTTLLNILGGIEKPTTGRVLYDKGVIEEVEFRKNKLSFVFQDFNLLTDLTLKENLEIVGADKKIIDKVLKLVDLEDKIKTKVQYLSGGERQRLAVARALSKNFEVLLLDEPTGNLDLKNSEIVFNLLKRISKDKLVVTVTHDLESALNFGDYILEISDGKPSEIKKIASMESIELRKKEILDDDLLKIYELLDEKNDSKVFFETEQKEETVLVNKSNYLSTINKKINNLESNQHYSLKISKNKINERLDYQYNQSENKNFNSRFQLKYALSIMSKNKLKSFFIFILLVISIMLIFVQSSLNGLNLDHTIYNAVKQKNDLLYSIETQIYNEFNDEYISINKGLYLKEKLIDTGNDIVLPFLLTKKNIKETDETGVIHVYSKDFESKLDFEGTKPINDSQIMITDFYAIKEFKSIDVIGKEINIFIPKIDKYFEFTITGIIKTEYDKEEISEKFSNRNYSYKHADSLIHTYKALYISEKIYRDILIKYPIQIEASNFFKTDSETKNYVTGMNNRLTYQVYDSNQLKLGRAPEKINEVVVSSYLLNEMGFSEVLEKEFSYKDLKSSPNYNLYLDKLNIFDIVQKVKIVGVTDQRTYDVLVTKEYKKAIANQIADYLNDGYSIFKPSQEQIKKINAADIKFRFNYLNPTYVLYEITSGSLKMIFLILEVTFIVLTLSVLTLFCYGNVKSKRKEIAIIKSLGINSKKIINIFYIQNAIQVFFALGISLFISHLFVYYFNVNLRKEDVFYIDYNLFYIENISYYITIFISIIVSLLATIVPFISINKIDIAVTMKNGNQ